ncbi:2-hydroxyacid dehydrogenase [Motiliproteus sediminis]|uniref:2-hydroxyacid dehydrogenase n=1 Tax=Motiliproteus sediminis TaxID=1468178 RepID=UPI001AEF6036|nr:2-hydroxyacid dehydrogenase [Motiliproteus sediminis]
MRAVFLDLNSLDFGDLDLSPLKAVAAVEGHAKTSPEQVVARLDGAAVAIVNKVVLTRDTLARLPELRHICIAATGTNNVDLAAATELGISVSNCQGYGTASVAQHVMGLMLALATRLVDYHAAIGRGEWQRSDQFCLLNYPILELRGKTLGVIGYGELGREVGRLAEAFGMQLVIAARPGTAPRNGRESLDRLLPHVDVLTLHCPLTAATRNLIGAEQLAAMKPGALLVNAARGGIVDEFALADALRSGHLGGAATDVLSVEPPREGNPLLDESLPNLIVTPHCAWGSREARQAIVAQLAENITSFAQGRPCRVVG